MDGNQDVKGVFKDKYEKLYNSANDGEALMKVLREVESRVSKSSLIEVEKVTPSLVKEAAKKLKPGKSDPMFSFTSDCFKNAVDVLYCYPRFPSTRPCHTGASACYLGPHNKRQAWEYQCKQELSQHCYQ